MGVTRETRLRSAFAHLYPELPAGVWLPASDVGAAMLLAQLKSAKTPVLGERLLDELHFEFRGGQPRGNGSALRTRATDAETPLPN